MASTRQLACILAADVVGFSSLMEKDETNTYQRVRALHDQLLAPMVKDRNGRIVKTMGDGVLAVFGSAVDAVGLALELQAACRNRERPQDKPLRLRIGINLGEIILDDGGDIFGEGVNIAARLESLAEPGGILVSGKVHDEISGRLPCRLEPKGAQAVKNIAKPVVVYAVSPAATRAGSAPDKELRHDKQGTTAAGSAMKGAGVAGELGKIAVAGLGALALAAVIVLAGPYLAIGDFRPLDSVIVRAVLSTLLVMAFAGYAAWKVYKRGKDANALAEGMAAGPQEDDSAELKSRIGDAVTTLRQSAGGRADALYDLPWYMIIGPPGSGKTTALVNSGLRFPLAGKATPAAVAGAGGTRYCDWWFTDEAILIDTAGRYTTQDSDARADRDSWLAFLDLLKTHRAQQPINGVLVAISLQDLLTLSPQELEAHSRAIRGRLAELHDRLKINFPVYVVFTKADLVAGFMEFFGNLGEQARRQVWGVTFQTTDKTKNLVNEVPGEFEALIRRLNQDLSDRLQEEPAPATRASLYGFPAQLAALKRPIQDFLGSIFEPTRFHANATLRGFYFTSGTQFGTPIDQLVNALVKNFGAQEVGGASYSGLGKSFFLTDLIQKVIIGEASWVSTDLRAVRRRQILRATAFAAILACAGALGGAWWVSYARNKALIEAEASAATEYASAAGPLVTENPIGDREFAKVLPALQKLRFLPAGYASRDDSIPLAAGFGLSQQERLASAGTTAYAMGLERLFRPRLLFRLEEVLNANKDNAPFIYEALKIYMMLGGRHPADKDVVVSWFRQDWAQNLYPGGGQSEGRKALEEHLVALLDLEGTRDPLVEISGPLLADSQATLARLSIRERAYEMLKSRARASGPQDWIVARAAGPDFARVFDVAGGDPEAVRVPGFYTYAGFQRAFLDQLGDVADKVKAEQWVLGKLAENAQVSDQYRTLNQDLLVQYGRDFERAWLDALAKMQMKPLTADKPRYQVLGSVGGPTSPLRSIFESIKAETALTKDRPDLAKPAAPGAAPAAAQPPRATLFAQGEPPPGTRIEERFRPFHEWTDGATTKRPIDELVAILSDINDSLITSANVPAQAAQANQQLQVLAAKLRGQANRLPDPFRGMILRASDAVERDSIISDKSKINADMASAINAICKDVTENKFPFGPTSRPDSNLGQFGKLFGPNGTIDEFFRTRLSKYVDTSGRDWKVRADMPPQLTMNGETLKQFQNASIIRDTFFAQGGSVPSLVLGVTPGQVLRPGAVLVFDHFGQRIESKPAGQPPAPSQIMWPGLAASGAGKLTITMTASDTPPGVGNPVIEQSGPWALFKLLATAAQRGPNAVEWTGVVGGVEARYQVSYSTPQNPFRLEALRQFKCPGPL